LKYEHVIHISLKAKHFTLKSKTRIKNKKQVKQNNHYRHPYTYRQNAEIVICSL